MESTLVDSSQRYDEITIDQVFNEDSLIYRDEKVNLRTKTIKRLQNDNAPEKYVKLTTVSLRYIRQ